MKIISSQHYIDDEIVAEKVKKLAGKSVVYIPCYYVGIIDGVEYAIQVDRHHTLSAARELGIRVEFEIGEDPEGLNGDKLLETRWIDGDWYNVETSNPAYGEFDLIW